MTRLAIGLLAGAAAWAQVRLPPFTTRTLDNGVTAILCVKKDVPMLAMNVIARGGDEADPVGMAGMGSLMVDLMQRGTKTRTAEAFAGELDFLGAAWRGQSGQQSFSVSVETLSANAAKAMDLVADAVGSPAFGEAEFKRALAQRIDGAKAAKDNPQAAIGRYFPPFFFGAAHPYGRMEDELSLAKITREAAVAQHAKMFAGKNVSVIVVGDFEMDPMAALLKKSFGGLAAGSEYSWVKDVAPPKRASARLLLVDKPDATQTYFTIAQPGIARTHPDRVALEIVNTLFGGRFTSMLNEELRVNSGLTYGARSQVEQDRLTGAIEISTFTKTETTVEAMDLTLAVLKRLREKGLDAEMLASAKAYTKGMYPTRALETHGQIARVLGDLHLFGLNKGEIDDYFSRIDALTVERVNEVARKYYGDENLQFCLIGAASKIQDKVKKYAPKMKVVAVTEPGYTVGEF
ncbi:MAG: pitrilysin family protein [Acidobacteriota bacterium]